MVIRKTTTNGNTKEVRLYFGNVEFYSKFVSSSLIVERQTVHIGDDQGKVASIDLRTFSASKDDNNTDADITRYLYSNHLQSASLELTNIGKVISYEEYHPYGTTSYTLSNTDIKAVAKRYRFTGKEKDSESGLYYHGARYYMCWLCRWCAVDPLESKYSGWSGYNYCEGNPSIYVDPTGKGKELTEYDKKLQAYEDGEKATQAQFQAKLNEIEASKANASFKADVAELGLDGFVALRDNLYQSKLAGHQTPFAKAINGTDGAGNIVISDVIRQRLWTEANSEVFDNYRMSWAIAKAKINPESLTNYVNPFYSAQLYSSLALTVSNKDEAKKIIKQVGLQIGIAWALHLVGGGGFANLKTTTFALREEYALSKLKQLELLNDAHFLSRYGAGTRLTQQYNRATLGLNPEGQIASKQTSTRFLTYTDQLKAYRLAMDEFKKTGEKTIMLEFNKTIGEGYIKSTGTYFATQKFSAKFNDFGQMYTMFPIR